MSDELLVAGRGRRRVREIDVRWWAALVVVAALVATGLWYRGRSRPPTVVITYTGSPVDNAAQVIAETDAAFIAFVAGHHGARSAHARCYFNRSGDWARTDVARLVYCGPVLFYGGAAPDVWMYYALTPSAAQPNGHVRFTVAGHPEIPTPVYLPRGAQLERPDGRTVSDRGEGLVAPGPPPANVNTLARVSRADLPALPAAPDTAVIGSRSLKIRLRASGYVGHFGRGIAKRVAPPGRQLLAFELQFTQGEIDPSDSTDTGAVVGLTVNEGRTRPLPVPIDIEWGVDAELTRLLVVAVPGDVRSVELVVIEDGITQQLSVLDGSPGMANIAILARNPKDLYGRAHSPESAVARIADRGTTRTAHLDTFADAPSLGFFSPYGPEHASGPDRALLHIDVQYWSGHPIEAASFGATNLTLVPTAGKPIRAYDIGNSGYAVFDVPASFRSGTVIVTGTTRNWYGSRVTLTEPYQVRISFIP